MLRKSIFDIDDIPNALACTCKHAKKSSFTYATIKSHSTAEITKSLSPQIKMNLRRLINRFLRSS